MLFDELLEEISEFAAVGFLVEDGDELLRKRSGSNLGWITTASDRAEHSRPRDKVARVRYRGPMSNNLAGDTLVSTLGGMEHAFQKLASISYAATGAKARGPVSAASQINVSGASVMLGGNGVFRASGSSIDALQVFAKVTAFGVANDIEDEEFRRRGGGGSAADAHSGGVLTAERLQQSRSLEQLAARAAIAAGAQPVVIKVISTVSAKASASALMEYLGTRENDKGEREDIPVFNQFGETIADAAGRVTLVAQWIEGFRESYSVSSCITVSLTVQGQVSDAALHEAMNVAFGEKPFVYSRDGERVDIYGVSDLTAGKLNAQIKARASGKGAIAYLSKAEDRMAATLLSSVIEASVTISGSTTSEKSAQYFLEKFMRQHQSLTTANGDRVPAKGTAHVLSKQIYSDWQPHLKTVHPRNAFHVVLSGRAGTDAKAMVRAVSDFLGEQIPDHKWVIAHHAETGHVHVHAMIAARDALGKPLRFTKPELFEWRENFAAKAREHGIAMVATRRADMAATRPFTQNQVGAYERARIDPRYAIQPSTRVRVEAKREGRAELVAMTSGNLALAHRWQRTATVLKLASPDAKFAYQAASSFVAKVQASRTDTVANVRAAPAAPTQLLSKFIQNDIKEIFSMAIPASEARIRIDNINRNFDQAVRLIPVERHPEFVAMRERINKSLEARYVQLATPVTPARQQVRDAIATHGRDVAKVQASRTDTVANVRAAPAAPTQLLSKFIQNDIKEILSMAIPASEARIRIDNINRNFDQAVRLIPVERHPEFVAMRERINKSLEARYVQLATPVTPARQQVRDAIATHGRDFVVEGIGVMVAVQAAQKKFDLAKTTGQDLIVQRQELEQVLVKAALLALQGNSYLGEIAKTDVALARAIESTERENSTKVVQDRTVERTGAVSIRVNPQDEARLKLVNAPREVHPIVLRQQAEKLAAEQREKALEEQKLKFAERAKAKDKDNDRGR